MDIRKSSSTTVIDLYVSGDYALVERALQEYTNLRGFCVSITPVNYIFTGGTETGFKIGIINYPRFPLPRERLMLHAEAIAYKVMKATDTASCSIVGPEDTVYLQVKPKEGDPAEKGPGCANCDFTGLLYDWKDRDPIEGWKMADRTLACECKDES